MIAVLVYRPNLADEDSYLEAVEVLALLDGQTEDAVQDWVVGLAARYPAWEFSIEQVTPALEFPVIPGAVADMPLQVILPPRGGGVTA